MATVWKHKNSPYWTAVFKNDNDEWQRKTTKKKDRTEAMKLSVEWERASAMGRDRTLTEATCREVIGGILERTTGDKFRVESLRTFSARWLKGKSSNRSGGTSTRYAGTVAKFLAFLDRKADLGIAAVTPSDCERFYDHLKETKLARATLIVEIKTIRTLFNAARRQGLTSTNPAASIELPDRVRQVERMIFTPEQVGMLLKAVIAATAEATDKASKEAAEEWRTAILLGYYAGLRLADSISLNWDNIDLMGGMLTFNMNKTGGRVKIPLHPTLSAHLTEIAADSGGSICPHLSAVPVGGRSGLSKQFLSLMRRSGISNESVSTGGQRNLSRLSYHSLRKSFNSALHNRGVDQELRMKLTGHKDRGVNDGYTETQIETLRVAVNKLPVIEI